MIGQLKGSCIMNTNKTYMNDDVLEGSEMVRLLSQRGFEHGIVVDITRFFEHLISSFLHI